MRKELKKVILIVMKDKVRYTFSIPKESSHINIYNSIIQSGEINAEDVEKVIYFPATLYDLEEIQYHYDDEARLFNDKELAINHKIDEFRKHRASLLKNLDLEFMRALEDLECSECRNKIVKVKHHFRLLPTFLQNYLKNFTVEEITSFNCFNNVYDINIINGGTGYVEVPTIEIEPPNNDTKGVQMQATCSISDGKVSGITVTQIGSGYIKAPKVTISKPAEGNMAIALASLPENDIFN